MLIGAEAKFVYAADPAERLITENFLKAHISMVADDFFEGRGPGTRGGELTAKYIATQLEAFGLAPGNNGSYFQALTMVGAAVDLDTRIKIGKGSQKKEIQFGKDFVAWTGKQTEEVEVSAELVFAGYGITAPEFAWDDFGEQDLSGKILMVLVNDPPSEDAKFFDGKGMTYYGRWLYKLEEARRRGALGAFIVHKDETAGYPWKVVENSVSVEQFSLELQPNSKAPMAIAGWMTQDTARQIAQLGGFDWQDLEKKAATKGFKAMNLGVTMSTKLLSKIRKFSSPNIIAVKRGSDPGLRDTYVLYCSHWDHFGVGKPDEKGDRIYNGALDNASGVGTILAIARAYAATKTKRSIIFLIPTAEETGLLGSEYYVKHPVFSLLKTVVVVNFDMVNVWAKTKDIFVLGKDRMTIGVASDRIGKKMSLRVLGELHPENGTYFRSDHWSFARMGVPATSVEFGRDFIGRSAEWRKSKSSHYHEPGDEVQPDWDYSATVQHALFAFFLGREFANSNKAPTWLPGREIPKGARF